MLNRISERIDLSVINKFSCFLKNDQNDYELLLNNINNLIKNSESHQNKYFEEKSNQNITLEIVQEYNSLLKIFRGAYGYYYQECPLDLLTKISNEDIVRQLKYYKELIDRNLNMYHKICQSLPEEQVIYDINNVKNCFEKIYVEKMRKKVTIIPPVYRQFLPLQIKLDRINKADLEYVDILRVKRPLIIPQLTSLENKNFITTNINNIDKCKKSIWEDNLTKKILQNRKVDIVINLNSFIKLSMAVINEIKEDCFIPFLKIGVKGTDRVCLIFDKPMYEKVNIEKEKKKNLKRNFLQMYSADITNKCKLESRVLRDVTYGDIVDESKSCLVKFINNHSKEIKDYSQDLLTHNVTERNIKLKSIMLDDNLSECSSTLVIDDNFTKNYTNENITTSNLDEDQMITEDSSQDDETDNEVSIPQLYSYCLSKVKDTNILFRYKSYVRLSNKDSPVKEAESIYCRILSRSENNSSPEMEELWKMMLGSKLNLCADLLNIVINEENKESESFTVESFEEIMSKNDVMKEKLSIAMGAVNQLLQHLQNALDIDPDFYCIKLSKKGMNLLRSVDTLEGADLDLRKFYFDNY